MTPETAPRGADHAIEIDFSGAASQAAMHELLQRAFGFPDFYGRNFHALVDCWSSLRSPEDGMSTITLPDVAGTLTIHAHGLTTLERDALFVLVGAIQDVNRRELHNGHSPMIYLLPA